MVEIGRGLPSDEHNFEPTVARPESDGSRYPSVEQKPITGDNSATVPQQKTSEVSVPVAHQVDAAEQIRIDFDGLRNADDPLTIESSMNDIFDANSGGQ